MEKRLKDVKMKYQTQLKQIPQAADMSQSYQDIRKIVFEKTSYQKDVV